MMRCHSPQVKISCISISGGWWRPFTDSHGDLGRTVLCFCTSEFLWTLRNISEDSFNNCLHILLW